MTTKPPTIPSDEALDINPHHALFALSDTLADCQLLFRRIARMCVKADQPNI